MAGAALRNHSFVSSHKRIGTDSEEEKGRTMKRTAYFAEMERRIENLEAGHWIEHELIEVDDA